MEKEIILIEKEEQEIIFIEKDIEFIKPATQDVIIDATTEIQILEPEAGFTGFNKVTINAVTNEIDKNIKPENIKKGIEILGVNGTVEGSNPPIDPFGLDDITINSADEECPYTIGLIFNLDWFGKGNNTIEFNRSSTSDYNSPWADYISFTDGEKIPWNTRSTPYTKTFSEDMIKENSEGDRLVCVVLHWRDVSNISSRSLGNTNNGLNVFVGGSVNKISINNINSNSLYSGVSNVVNEISGCGNCNAILSYGYCSKKVSNVVYSKFDSQINFYNAYALETMSNVDFEGATLYGTASAYKGNNMRSLKNIENIKNLDLELDLRNSNKMLLESWINLFNALVETTTTKSLTLGTPILNNIPDEIKLIATSKGWTLK